LITEQSDVKTHRDYSLTLGFTLLYLPPLPDLDFGLCARVFSAVFLPLEPAIPFFNWSAVSHIT